MTQETDKTQALIDFVRLVWKVEKQKPEEQVAYFLEQFRTKLRVKSCLKEYTSESFFHRLLNTGLRALKRPSELTYLRLPFSHLFWSIKRIYHRHKRAMSAEKKEESKKVNALSGVQDRREGTEKNPEEFEWLRPDRRLFVHNSDSICCRFVRRERQNGDRKCQWRTWGECTTMGSLTFPATLFTVSRRKSWSTLLMCSKSFLFIQLSMTTIWSSTLLFWSMGA